MEEQQAKDPTTVKEPVLNPRQRAFVDAYLGPANSNVTRAARMAGYSEKTAYSIGGRLLKNVEVAAEIRRRWAEKAMPQDEVIARMSDQARGTLADLLDEFGRFSLTKAHETGAIHLIKKLAYFDADKGGGVKSIELYDAQGALEKIGRALSLFVDRQELSGPGGSPIPLSLADALDRFYGSPSQSEPDEQQDND